MDGGTTWGKLQIVGVADCGGGYECGYETTVQDLTTGMHEREREREREREERGGEREDREERGGKRRAREGG